MRPFITPLLEKFKFDNVKKYFLDYLSITFHLPVSEASSTDLIIANDIKRYFYSEFQKWIVEKRILNDKFYGVHCLESTSNKRFHSITIQFSGRFWAGDIHLKWHRILNDKGFPLGSEELVSYVTLEESIPTTNILDDIYKVIPVFDEIEHMINHLIWDIWKDRSCTNTVSRIDLARQSKSSLNKGFKNMPHFWYKNKDQNLLLSYYHVGTTQFTAFKIGKEGTSNEIDRSHPHLLRVYDKNHTKDNLNKLICLNRFKTTNVIRKEWELKRRFFGLESSHKISSFWDLVNTINHEEKLLHLIKCMRLTKDCVLFNDSQKYYALHDKESRRLLKKAHKIPLYQLNKLFKKVIPKSPNFIFGENKAQPSDFSEPRIWNAFKHLRGTLYSKKVQLSQNEKTELIQILKEL